MDKVRILGLEYRVQEVSVVSRDEYRLGEIDYYEQIIRLDENIKPDRRQQVLLHEVLHGIFDALGLTDEGQNEQLVQSMAMALHQVFRDNPGLLT